MVRRHRFSSAAALLLLVSATPVRACYFEDYAMANVALFGANMAQSIRLVCDTCTIVAMSAWTSDSSVATVTQESDTEFTVAAVGDGAAQIDFDWTLSGTDSYGYDCANYNDYEEPVSVQVTIPRTDSTANTPSSGTTADPVDTFSGELFFHEPPDLVLGGPLPLYIQRYYASYMARSNVHNEVSASRQSGDNWRHNFEWDIHWTGNRLILIDHLGKVFEFSSDGAGNWTQESNLDIPFQVVEGTDDIAFLDPRSDLIYRFTVPNEYTEGHVLTSVEDGKGNALTLTYFNGSGGDFYSWSHKGRLAQVSDGNGRALQFGYWPYTVDGESLGMLYKVTEVQDGVAVRRVLYEHNATANGTIELTKYYDAAYDSGTAPNHVTTYAYAPEDGEDRALLVSKTYPEGNVHYQQDYYTTTESVTASGRVQTQTDASGNPVRFGYDSGDTTITGPDGSTRSHTHTDAGTLTGLTDTQNASASFGHDAVGRRTSVTDKLGDTTRYTYHEASGKLASTTDAEGNTTRYSYTARTTSGFTFHDLTAIDYPDGSTETLAYDSAGNLTAFTDRGGNEWQFAYNGAGQPTEVTNPVGGSATYTYNADMTLATLTDAAGVGYSFGYDSSRRVTSITGPQSDSRGYTYDELDHVLSFTDEAGRATTYSYDLNGNLIQVNEPSGDTYQLAYDAMDRLQSVTDPAGNAVSAAFDANGRLASVTAPTGESLALRYGSNGRLTGVTDPGGNTWSLARDAEGVLSGIADPLGNAQSLSTDALGRTTAAMDSNGNFRGITRDSSGRVTGFVAPGGGIWSLARDSRGLITRFALPGGLGTVDYEYDGLGKVIGITDPNGNVWTTAYDAAGRRTSSTDPLGHSTGWSYDTLGRVGTVTFPNSGTLDYTYDTRGNVTRLLYSDGTDLAFTYDGEDHLTGAPNLVLAYDAEGRISDSNGLAVARDGNGRITQLTLATGKAVDYFYDANGQLASIGDWTGATTNFSYDAAGRLVGISRPNGVDSSFGYDGDGRLVSIDQGALASVLLTRNADGFISSAERQAPEVPTISSDETGGIGVDSAHQDSAATYDTLGRLSGDASRSYTWNLADRLVGYSDSGVDRNMGYDGLGLRVSRSDGTDTDIYVWNYALRRPAVNVVRRNGADFRYYVTMPDSALLYAIDAADEARHDYHFDEAGNTSFVTDANGTVTARYAYTPYGEKLASGGNYTSPFTWQGRYQVMDEGSGLYMMRARYYDSGTGRFVSRDPVRDTSPLGVNPYQYAYGNPTKLGDPEGRTPNSGDIDIGILFGEAFGQLDALYESGWLGSAVKSNRDIDDRDDAFPHRLSIGGKRSAPKRETVNAKPPTGTGSMATTTSLTTRAACACGSTVREAPGKKWIGEADWVGVTGGIAAEAAGSSLGGAGFSAFWGAYTETGSSLDRGQTEGASAVNGVGSGLIDAAFGTACAPAAIVDSATGGNVANTMKQAVRVPTAFVADTVNGNSRNTRALQGAIKRGELSAGVQEVYECGETWAENGVGGTIGKLFGAFGIGL